MEPGLFETNFQKNQLRAARSDDPTLAYAPYVESYNSRHDQFDWFAADPIRVAEGDREGDQLAESQSEASGGVGLQAGDGGGADPAGEAVSRDHVAGDVEVTASF